MTKDEALKLALEALGNTWTEPKSEQYKVEKEAITAIKEVLAQPEQAPMNYYRADAKGNLERTDIHFAQPEQDGECKYCTDGCPACDARKLQKETHDLF